MGYVEGRNLALEYRAADSREDRLAPLAGELVARRVDAIAVFAGPPIVAAKAATTSIPIIFFTSFDPVASGFVASLHRPGGNATRITVLNTEVMAKRLEVLLELVPSARSSIGVPLHSSHRISCSEYDRLGARDTVGIRCLRCEAAAC